MTGQAIPVAHQGAQNVVPLVPVAPLAHPAPEENQYPYEDWQRTEEHHAQTYADPYWQQDNYGNEVRCFANYYGRG